MKQKKVIEEGEHEVTLTVTIAKASLTDHDFDKRRSEVPQVQNYFHCEYKFLPDDKDFIKTDVVTFGLAAKLYSANDSKVLRTWMEGNKTWVTWTNTRQVRVTVDTLLNMFKHKFEVKIWDSRDKVSPRARFDRPKAFRLPSTKSADEVDLDNIRALLLQEGKSNMHLGNGFLLDSNVSSIDLVYKTASKKIGFVENDDKSINSKQSHVENTFIGIADSKLEVQVRLDENNQPEFKNLITLASTGTKLVDDVVESEEKVKRESSSERLRSRKQKHQPKKVEDITESPMTSPTLKNHEIEKIQQNGLTSISIPMSALFAKCLSVSNNIKEPINTLEEVIVILTLDKSLLSEYQRQLLNPMVLTVATATQMPDNGLSFDDLKLKCLPPYLQYKFHDCPVHISEGKEHKKTIRFNDRNVFLLGTVNREHLNESLRGPPLRIEVHDRDPKDFRKKISSVFGSRPGDDAIWNVTYTESHTKDVSSTLNNSVLCGIAEFDLSELLSGERILEMISPIRRRRNSHGSVDTNLRAKHGIQESNIPPGDYLEYGSDLKIKVELARSLTANNMECNLVENRILNPVASSFSQCPFSRIVYIFDYKNKKFLGEILTQASEINAKALNLSSYPQHVIDAALSTYKLNDEEKESATLDIITGCQIIDGTYHMFILEGLTKEGLQLIWDRLEHPEYNENSFFRVLYNSDMSFSRRMYQSLDVDLTRVKLHQPLDCIVKQPLLYVRDMIPKLCFEAVTKLYQLCQCKSLQSAVRNELLPTAEMIVSLGKEFGVPLSENDFHNKLDMLPHVHIDLNETVGLTPTTVSFKHARQPLNLRNKEYEKILENRRNGKIDQKNYVCANIKSLLSLAKEKICKPLISCDQIQVAHNYSSQKLNSTEMANEKLKEILSQEEGSRYTYCEKYQSATLVPVSVEKLSKVAEKESKENWKTTEGFVFPGVKSSTESNHNPHQVDAARIQELNLPWRAHILHSNIVKPTVDRLLFKWEDRDMNFNTWSPPEPFFGKPALVTLHAAGDTLQNEQIQAKMKEEQEWKEKLVVADPKFKTHRCLVATELTNKGSKASNLHSKLGDILKDGAEKYALSKPGMYLNPIPALSIVSYPNVDTQRCRAGDILDDGVTNSKERNVGYTPGELSGVSWSRDKNAIPIKDYQHGYFEGIKGHDFRLVHTDHEKKKAMKVKPLSRKERDTNLFDAA